jgi:hypothetical protein
LTVADILAGLIGDVGAPITANDASHPAATPAVHLAVVIPGRFILFHPRLRRVVSRNSWMLRVLVAVWRAITALRQRARTQLN